MPYTPEQYPFIGPEKDNPAAAARLAEIMSGGWSFEGEVQPTTGELAEINNVHTAIGIVGDELKVDLRSRLPQPGEETLKAYKFFEDKDAFVAAVHRVYPDLNPTGGAIYITGMGVLYLRPKGGSEMGWFRSVFSHEDDHMVAQMPTEPRLWVPDGHTTPQIQFNTYHVYGGDDSTKGGFRESVTDLGADRQTRIRGEKDLNYSYGPQDLLLDGTIQKAAEKQGMDPKELGDLILKGQYTGDMTGIGLIAEKFSPANFVRLTVTDSDMSYEDALKLAQATGLDAVVDHIKAYGAQDYSQRPFAWNEPADDYRIRLPQYQSSDADAANMRPPQTRETITTGGVSPAQGQSAGAGADNSAIEQAAASVRTAIGKVESSMAAQLPAYVSLESLQGTIATLMGQEPQAASILGLLDRAQKAVERASSYQDRGCILLDGYLGAVGVAASGTIQG